MHDQTKRLFYSDDSIDRKDVFGDGAGSGHPRRTVGATEDVSWNDNEAVALAQGQMDVIVDYVVHTECPITDLADYCENVDKEFAVQEYQRFGDARMKSTDHRETVHTKVVEWVGANVDTVSLASVTNLTEGNIYDTLTDKIEQRVIEATDWPPEGFDPAKEVGQA